MRVFIAIPLPAELRAKLSSLQQEFRRLPLEATWVREAGFHVTLKFLGEVEPTQIPPIVACMIDTAHCYPPFELTLIGVGVFPHESRPRVLWVGIQDETGVLAQLQHALEERLTPIGYGAEDRPFTAHLTLARVKYVPRRGEFIACVYRHREVTLGHLQVDHLELLESQLHPGGARYSTIKAAYLAATDANSGECERDIHETFNE
jgi:RNA 2',3'-cyclic 3'-phosphodiesterase